MCKIDIQITEQDLLLDFHKQTGNRINDKIESFRNSDNYELVQYLDWLQSQVIEQRKLSELINRVNEEFSTIYKNEDDFICCGRCKCVED